MKTWYTSVFEALAYHTHTLESLVLTSPWTQRAKPDGSAMLPATSLQHFETLKYITIPFHLIIATRDSTLPDLSTLFPNNIRTIHLNMYATSSSSSSYDATMAALSHLLAQGKERLPELGSLHVTHYTLHERENDMLEQIYPFSMNVHAVSNLATNTRP